LKGNVTVEVFWNFAKVPFSLEHVLRPILTYPRTGFRSGGCLGHERARSFEKLYWKRDGSLCIPVGLTQIVIDALKQAGLSVGIQDRRAPMQFTAGYYDEPDRTYTQTLAEPRRRIILAENLAKGGVIEIDGPADRDRWIIDFCLAYPRARILIPVATRAQISALLVRLRGPLDDDLSTVKDWTWGPKKQDPCDPDLTRPLRDHRLICSLEILDVANELDWDIVLVPDITQAIVPSHSLAVMWMASRRRLYGFLPRQHRLSWRQRLWLTI
jgi:hypothetical protein